MMRRRATPSPAAANPGAGVRPGATRDGRARGGLALAMALGLAGCSLLGPQRLDVPPGWRVVVGRVVLDRFGTDEAVLPMVRDDRGYRHDLVVGRGRPNFLITLPKGRYRISQIGNRDDGRAYREDAVYYVRVAFDVGAEPVTYVGTLRVRRNFDETVALEVLDEYEATVPDLQPRYPQLAEPTTRSLFRLE